MLLPFALLAATAAGPSLPAGSYKYAASLSGVSAGSSTLTVTTGNGSTQIDESASGSASGFSFSGSSVLVLGADLAPTQYNGKYLVAGQQATVSVALTPTTATVTPPAGGTPQTFALDPNATHFVVIEPGLLSGIFALPAQMQAWNGAAVTAIAPAQSMEGPLSPDAPAQKPQRPNGVPASDAVLSLGGRIPFTVWYDPATMIPDEIDVPSQGATVTRVRG
jgi:hypothetical protein